MEYETLNSVFTITVCLENQLSLDPNLQGSSGSINMDDIFRSFEGAFGGGSPFGRAGGPFGSPQRGQDFQVWEVKRTPNIFCLD